MRAVVAILLLGLLPSTAAAQQPRAKITDGPPAETESQEATFAFEASGFAPFTRFECSLDKGPWAGCTAPVKYASLAGGRHEFAVRLVGALADPTPDSRSWTVLVKTVIEPPPPPPPAVAPPPPPATIRPRPNARRDARGCAYGANRVGEVSIGRLEAATACLVDRLRAARELPRLRRVRSLALAGERHARDMVRRRYFAHRARSGSHADDRARRSGYLRDREGWIIAEVLAWGTGGKSTPVATVDAWMRSRGHRRVLVHAALRDLGVGIARGIPLAGRADGGTFVAVLGRR